MVWRRASESRFDLADIRRKKEVGERYIEERRRKRKREVREGTRRRVSSCGER